MQAAPVVRLAPQDVPQEPEALGPLGAADSADARALDGPKYSLLVTIFEGRNFQRKPLQKVYIQCQFNDEVLTTDPVDQEANPVWDTELAWNVDSRTLHYLRSQRVNLKLSCYTIDENDFREQLGFFMLDLRAAQDAPAPDHWKPLVNVKATPTFRPELRYSFGMQMREQILREPQSASAVLSLAAQGAARAARAKAAAAAAAAAVAARAASRFESLDNPDEPPGTTVTTRTLRTTVFASADSPASSINNDGDPGDNPEDSLVNIQRGQEASEVAISVKHVESVTTSPSRLTLPAKIDAARPATTASTPDPTLTMSTHPHAVKSTTPDAPATPVEPRTPRRLSSPASPASPPSPNSSMHSTLEYRAAMEVELWKQQEQKRFAAKLAGRETELLQALAVQWAKREQERSEQWRQRSDAQATVLNDLKRLAGNLDVREGKLVRAEEDLAARADTLQREHERQLTTARDAARRLQEEYAHRLSLAQLRQEELQAAATRAADERRDMDARCRALELEADELRKRAAFAAPPPPTSAPATSHPVEMARLQAENASLEARLDAAERLKTQYKTDLAAALDALAKLRTRHEENQRQAAVWEGERAALRELGRRMLGPPIERATAVAPVTGPAVATAATATDAALQSDQTALSDIKQQLQALIRQQRLAHERQSSAKTVSRPPTRTRIPSRRLVEIPSVPAPEEAAATPPRYPVSAVATATEPAPASSVQLSSLPDDLPSIHMRESLRSVSPELAGRESATPLDLSVEQPVPELNDEALPNTIHDPDLSGDEDIFSILKPRTADHGHAADRSTLSETPSTRSGTSSTGTGTLSAVEADTAVLAVLADLVNLQPLLDRHLSPAQQLKLRPRGDSSVGGIRLRDVIADRDRLRELVRLLSERNGLLATGIYVRDDRLIVDFETRITAILETGLEAYAQAAPSSSAASSATTSANS